jgi:hypothetical protein
MLPSNLRCDELAAVGKDLAFLRASAPLRFMQGFSE